MQNNPLPINPKIKSLEELVRIREDLRQNKKKVVTTNGSYDVFHAGHAWSLQESKAQGDMLMVGLNSDKSIKQYKSPKRPIIAQHFRAEVIAALDCVDYVFVFDETTPNMFLEKLRPDVHTNSSDYGEQCVEAETVIKMGARLHLLKKYDGLSTTEIIEKIKRL